MILVLAIYVGEMRMMNKELAQYINTLLGEKEREVKKEQVEYNEIYRLDKNHSVDPERMVVWGQELSYERHMIYKCQKAMDYIIEEDELNYPPHLRGDVIGKAKEAFAHTNKKEDT